MIAINQNYFSLNFNDFEATATNKHSFIENIKVRIELFKKLHTFRAILKSNFNNFDTYVLIGKLDSIEKIDEVLITLEDLSEFTNDILDNKDYKSWANFPMRYMANKIEDWNMALQGLLLSRQAHL
ncbi:hypothetical protein KKC13_00840 [bacterium]|nr:hypothetical protein [bacterium]MBU1958941.1 hypothetical protein [bacterium]